MSRLLCLTLAAALSLAAGNLARSQDAASTTPAASPGDSSADAMAKLQTENAALKKEVADASRTIAQLQAQLAAAGQQHQTVTTPDAEPPPVALSSTNGTPERALPLDSTNAVTTAPDAPAANAGPSRSYTVVKGDSLWKIAHKMYPGDTKNGVDKIQEANKDAIGDKPLKIGQVLIIPQ